MQGYVQPREHRRVHAKGYSLTHMSESVLQDHTGSAVTGSVNMSEGVF